MADAGTISAKALKVYQDKGIIEPALTDSVSGYRYYSLDQLPILDDIAILQSIGFSLEEIKECLDAADPDFLRTRLEEKHRELDEQERELKQKRIMLDRMSEACESIVVSQSSSREGHGAPYELVEIPDRHVLLFDIEPVGPDDRNNEQWERAIVCIRRSLSDHDLPARLYRQVGAIIPKRDLEAGTLVTTRAFMILDESSGGRYGREATLPGGLHLVRVMPSSLMEDGTSREYGELEKMMRYAESNGLAIDGDYTAETIASTPSFGIEARDAAFKMMLPVRRTQAG